MHIQYLLFDKEGNNLNLEIQEGNTYYTGNIYFPISSVRVPSVEHIYVVSENGTSINKVDVVISFGQGEESIFKGFYRDKGQIVEDVFEFNGQINIYTEHNEAGIYEDVLTIRDKTTNRRIAVINLEVELYDEEERFKDLLNNLYNPELLPDTDIYYAFRQSNVKEKNIDYKILNTKRKELLMLGHEIFPFIGADKALVNMINFLGYADADIKEIWHNINEDSINFDRIKYIQNRYQAYKRGEKVDLTFEGSEEWEKTNRFGIFFKINRPANGVDNDNLPIVVDNFEFTIDEILLKFKKVRDYLNKKFLPLNVKLHSITGEGIYFERIKVNTFNENTDIYNIELDLEPEIIINNQDRILFLEDQRKYDERYFETYDIDKTKTLLYYRDRKIALSAKETAHKVFQDHVNVPVGSRVYLEIGGLFSKVNDLQFTFNTIKNTFPKIVDPQDPTKNLNTFGTWDFIKFGDKYECEWRLTNIETGYVYKNRDFIQNNYKHIAIIPYIGTYDVQLRIWDLDNKESISILRSEIEIRMHNPLMRHFRFRDTFASRLNDLPFVRLNRISGQLNNLFSNNFKVSDFVVNISSFKATAYLHDETFKDYSANVTEFNRDNRYIKLDNISGDIERLRNTKIIGKNQYPLNIKEIPFDVVSNKLMILGSTGDLDEDMVKNEILNHKGLIVNFYEKKEVTDYDLLIENVNDVQTYFLLINDVGFLQRFKVENEDSEIEEKEFYAKNISTDTTYNYRVEILEEVYHKLNEDFSILYNTTNFYVSEIVGFDDDNGIILFKDPDPYRLQNIDLTNNDPSISSVSISNGESEIGKIVYMDMISSDEPFVISTFTFNSDNKQLYVLDVNRYHLMNSNTVIYWNRFDVNIIETRENANYDLTKYINSLNIKRSFTLYAEDYYNTFLDINGERYSITDESLSPIENLNSFDLPFYFLEDPINTGYILGIKKLDNDYDNYTIETYNGLLVNDKNLLELIPDFKRTFTLNNIEIFNNTTVIDKNKDTFFTLSETNIPGLKKSVVTIQKDDRLIFETDRRNFTYNFKESGYYNVILRLTDNNKNEVTKTLNRYLNVK